VLGVGVLETVLFDYGSFLMTAALSLPPISYMYTGIGNVCGQCPRLCLLYFSLQSFNNGGPRARLGKDYDIDLDLSTFLLLILFFLYSNLSQTLSGVWGYSSPITDFKDYFD
jgi:hypothetical protein